MGQREVESRLPRGSRNRPGLQSLSGEEAPAPPGARAQPARTGKPEHEGAPNMGLRYQCHLDRLLPQSCKKLGEKGAVKGSVNEPWLSHGLQGMEPSITVHDDCSNKFSFCLTPRVTKEKSCAVKGTHQEFESRVFND